MRIRNARRAKTWILFVGMMGFALISAFTAGAEEQSPVTANPETKGRIEKCIGRLGDADPAVREAATEELVKIGAPAAEAAYRASKGGDAEVAQRADQVLLRLKWVAPEVREKIQALRKARDARTWERLWSELSGLGDAARAALSQEMTTPDGDLKLDVGTPKRTRRKELFSCDVGVRNAGKTGIWIDRTLLQVNPGASEKWSVGKSIPAPLAPARLVEVMNRAPDTQEKEARFVYLAPGEALSQKMGLNDPEHLDFAGRIRIQAEYLGGDPANRPANPARTFQVSPPYPSGSIKIACLKKDVSGESEWVELVPDLAKASDGLSLGFAEGAQPSANADGIGVRLTLRNDAKEPIAILAEGGKDQPGYWFILMDGKGSVAQFGPLSARPKENRETELKPSGKIETEGRIVPSVPPGTYTLVCGFSGHGMDLGAALDKLNLGKMNILLAGDRNNIKKEWIGDARTAPLEIVIPKGGK